MRSWLIWLMCSKPSLPGNKLTKGQIVRVKVLETDEKGRVKLSMKALMERPAAEHQGEHQGEPRHHERQHADHQHGDRAHGGEGHNDHQA